MKTKRIDALTAEQTARMPEWRDKWISIGLSTERADRGRFERAIPACYAAAELPPPKRVVWVSSPLVMALAAPLAANLLGKGGAVDDAVRGAVHDAVRDAVSDAVGEIQNNWYKYLGGQFWVGGWYWGSPSYVSFFREVCGLDLGDMAARALAYEDTAASASWWWPHTDFVMAVERPTHIDRDPQGRLHSEARAAIAWPDGWGVHSWHGVRVPAWVIEHPEQITAEKIDRETNAEIRRVMIVRFGIDRYAASGEQLDADADQFGRPRRLVRRRFTDGSPDLVMVLVKNSTPEPDGSIRDYALCVHPEIRPMYADGKLGPPQKATCQNAVASLAGKSGKDYAPQVET